MLLVGLPGCGPGHPAARRLTELGPVPGTMSMPPPRDLADPSVVILTGTGPPGGTGLPGQHLVMGAATVPEVDIVLDGAPEQIGELRPWPVPGTGRPRPAGLPDLPNGCAPVTAWPDRAAVIDPPDRRRGIRGSYRHDFR